MTRRTIGRLCSALFLLAYLATQPAAVCDSQPSPFLHRDTNELISIVNRAAEAIAREGEEAFVAMSRTDSEWNQNDHYIFVYDSEGQCVVDPVESGFIGENLRNLEDFRGQPVVSQMLDLAANPARDASDWFFYLWENPHHSSPVWKGTYVRKAVAPSGKIYVVGSGLYNVKIEKAFVEATVDRAANLLAAEGRDRLFSELINPASRLNILDLHISVLASDGTILVDPAFPNLAIKRNLANYTDGAGRNFFQSITRSLSETDCAWSLRILPRSDSPRMDRHLVYSRRVSCDGETFYLTTGFVPASPIWMK